MTEAHASAEPDGGGDDGVLELGSSGDLLGLLRSLPGDFLLLDGDARVRWCSPGILRREAPGRDQPPPRLAELDRGFHEAGLGTAARRVFRARAAEELEVRDGEGRWYHARVLPCRQGEDVARVLIALEDVTERKRSEQRYRRLSSLTVDLLGIASVRTGRWIEVSAGTSRTLGWTEEELLATPFLRLVHPGDVQTTRVALAELGAGRPVVGFENRLRCRDGSYRWIEWHTAPSPEEGLIYAVGRDVTGRKKTQRALRDSEAQFRAVADLVPDLLWRSDGGGGVTWVNRRWCEYTGQSPDEARGLGWRATIHPADRERSRILYDEALQGGEPFEYERRIRRHDGDYRWFLVRGVPLKDGSGRVRDWFGSATDVHAQRKSRELLEKRVSERTREIRALAETLATAEQEERQRLSHVLHDDLQQLLYGAQMKLTLAGAGPVGGDPERAMRHVEEAKSLLEAVIHRTRELTSDLNPPVQGEGLLRAMEWLRGHMRELHGLHVEVEADGPAEGARPDLDALIFQIVRELLFNVVKHAGTDRALVRIRPREDGIVVSVIDEGEGADPEALTDPSSAGGLGLVAARERLRIRGGRLEIESAPGKGTRVDLFAPFESGEAASEARRISWRAPRDPIRDRPGAAPPSMAQPRELPSDERPENEGSGK